MSYCGRSIASTWDTEAEAKTYATKFDGPNAIRDVVWDIEPKTKRWTTIRRVAASGAWIRWPRGFTMSRRRATLRPVHSHGLEERSAPCRRS
jgi:hypothetical protein